MTPEQAAALRAPFPPEAIGKLPRVTCQFCSKSQDKHCDKHSRQKCATCGAYITTAHIHLDYVGHAATTDRLLQVDPEWSWEPFALDPSGWPLIQGGQFWIRLNVAGVTRYGVGDGDTPKVMIGDAIRNAAMRFGVALDLWAKEDLNATHEPPEPTEKLPALPPKAMIDRLVEAVKANGLDAWVKDQSFPWPWTAEACAAIEYKLNTLEEPF